MAFAWARTKPQMRARNRVESIFMVILVVFSSIAILTTLGIVLSVLFESLRFFQEISPLDFFFGTLWSPQTALRADQVGASGAFGAVPLFTGTLMVSAIAMLVAVPIGLMSAIYLSEYAPRRSVLGQADPRGPGRCADRGLRLLRRPDRRPLHPRARHVAWG
jgi:phosphate transport system permease protein